MREIFLAYDTFTVAKRGRVFTGCWRETPTHTEREMIGRDVRIEAPPEGYAGRHPDWLKSGHGKLMAALLSQPRLARIKGIERFRTVAHDSDKPFLDGEQCGILVDA